MIKLKTSFFRASIRASVIGLLSIGQISTAMAATIKVCPDPAPEVWECNYETVEAGLAAAMTDDTVLVGTPGRTVPEIYTGNINMKDSVSLVSEGDDFTATYTESYGQISSFFPHLSTVLKRTTLTILQGTGATPVVSFSSVNNTVLDGFTIENLDPANPKYTAPPEDMALISVDDSSPTIQNNIVRNNQGPGKHNGGISMASGATKRTPLIKNNVIHYVNGPGIYFRSNTVPTIEDNQIYTTPPTTTTDIRGTTPGIGLRGDVAATIRGNHIFKCGKSGGIGSGSHLIVEGENLGYGITNTADDDPIIIKGNEIKASMDGAAIRLYAMSGQDVSDVDIVIGGPTEAESNIFDHNKAGIFISHETYTERFGSLLVENNNFNTNGTGLKIHNVAEVTVKDNIVSEQYAGRGMMFYNCDNVIVQNNTITNGNYAGIYISNLLQPMNWLIENNTIELNDYGGIYLKGKGDTGIIRGNHITGNSRGGILMVYHMTVEITDNEIDSNSVGGIHSGKKTELVFLPLGPTGFFGTVGELDLTIRGNKIHDNGQSTVGGGIDVRHASGVIENNLVYNNAKGGIRFGNWITAINHNTVIGNGVSGDGAGIVYAYYDPTGDPASEPTGSPSVAISIKNNIVADNAGPGINAGTKASAGATCSDWVGNREYNLLSGNKGAAASCPSFAPWCKRPQLSLCNENDGEIFAAPGFVDAATYDYHLGTGSVAIDGGDPDSPVETDFPPAEGDARADMGAYGGPNGIGWTNVGSSLSL